jgi:hypothetical protein
VEATNPARPKQLSQSHRRLEICRTRATSPATREAMAGRGWALCVLVLLGVLPPSFVAHAGRGPGAPVPSSSPSSVLYWGLDAAPRAVAPRAKTMRLKGGIGEERTRKTEARSRQKTQEMEVDAEHEVEAAVKRRAQVSPLNCGQPLVCRAARQARLLELSACCPCRLFALCLRPGV